MTDVFKPFGGDQCPGPPECTWTGPHLHGTVAGPDPRDAEIARLTSEVERLRDLLRGWKLVHDDACTGPEFQYRVDFTLVQMTDAALQPPAQPERSCERARNHR